MKECPHCSTRIEKHAVYANHVRWCKQNPTFREVLESTKARLSSTAATKRGISKRFDVTCLKARGHQVGEKNNQYGKCWITDGIKPIMVKKSNLNEYFIKGYSLGR